MTHFKGFLSSFLSADLDLERFGYFSPTSLSDCDLSISLFFLMFTSAPFIFNSTLT